MPQESYVILGNDALVKCDIPSFVTDLVQVTGWTDNDGNEFIATANSNYGKDGLKLKTALYNRDCSMHIERATMHCQGIACTRSFGTCITSAEGQI